jgi:hypothetical protein
VSSLPRLLDLTDDGHVGFVDALGWVVALSALGLSVLVVGAAVFTALLWTVKGVMVGARLAWRGAGQALAGSVRSIRWTLTGGTGRFPERTARTGQARSHQASSSSP